MTVIDVVLKGIWTFCGAIGFSCICCAIGFGIVVFKETRYKNRT